MNPNTGRCRVGAATAEVVKLGQAAEPGRQPCAMLPNAPQLPLPLLSWLLWTASFGAPPTRGHIRLPMAGAKPNIATAADCYKCCLSACSRLSESRIAFKPGTAAPSSVSIQSSSLIKPFLTSVCAPLDLDPTKARANKIAANQARLPAPHVFRLLQGDY